jgi:hypothetical protein
MLAIPSLTILTAPFAGSQFHAANIDSVEMLRSE